MEAPSSRIYRVMKTLLQMVKDRDFFVSQRELSLTLEEFLAREDIGSE